MEVKIYIYDSFTDKRFKGNQAAVVLDADELTDGEMKNIAKELNYSETVFLFKSQIAFKKVRFFTPNGEVDLCGHATIAYIQCLFDNKFLNLKEAENILEIETNLGKLPISIYVKNEKIENIMMYQDEAQLDREVSINLMEIEETLNLKKGSIGDLKIIKAYTGIWDLLIHIKNKEILYKIDADLKKIKEISKKLHIISFHIFALEEKMKGNIVAYVRNFAPIVNIDEEAATGTSNGALAYYLYKEKYLSENNNLICIQGKNMNRESVIMAKIINGKVLVGGMAVKVFEGIMLI